MSVRLTHAGPQLTAIFEHQGAPTRVSTHGQVGKRAASQWRPMMGEPEHEEDQCETRPCGLPAAVAARQAR